MGLKVLGIIVAAIVITWALILILSAVTVVLFGKFIEWWGER